MNVLAAFKLIKSAKDVVDYVTKDNNLDKSQEGMTREIKVLKKEIQRLHDLTESHRTTLMDLIQSTHNLTVDKEKRDKLKKDLGK
jgi:esterase/lipase